MPLDLITSFLGENAGIIGRYILIPIWVGLFIFVLLELLSRKKGITLSQEFHTKSFAVSVSVVFGWLFYLLLPSGIFLPMKAMDLKFVLGIFMLIVTFQYVVYLMTELLSPQKTVVSLGISAGLVRSTLAAGVMSKTCAGDPGATYLGATAISVAKATLVLRNFLIITIVGMWLGLFSSPPLFFVVPMLLMFAACAIAAVFFYKQSGGGPAEFEALSLKASVLFIVVFIVLYYLALGIISNFGFLGLYALSGVAGFLYGAAHLFIVASMLFLGEITIDVALIAAVIVTLGSMLSDLPYTFFSGARELTKVVLISAIVAFAAGLISLVYLLL